MLCPCGSCKPFSLCCEPYYSILNLKQNCPDNDKILIDWLEKYSEPIEKTFMSKTEVYIFRISLYFNKIFDSYFTLGFKPYLLQQKELDNQIISIKLNILHSLIASLSCLSQGLFLQSGIILRSLIEDCLVLLDISENDEQLQKFVSETYSINNLISRTKKSVPPNIIEWYGYFSANFTHFGQVHSAPYLPRACYSDNYVIVVGLQNLIRAIVTIHIVLERIYFKQVPEHFFWKEDTQGGCLKFNNESTIFSWTDKLGSEINQTYPLNEHKKGYNYSDKTFKFK